MKIYFMFMAASLMILTSGCTKSCGKNHEEKQEHGKAEEASVFFVEPANNAQVTSPVKVVFGLKGMKVRPALEDVQDKSSGHHHILIDHPQGFIEKGQVITADEKHIHYGKGETEAVIELSPGVHTLTLQLADGAHISYGKELSATISVTVVEKAQN